MAIISISLNYLAREQLLDRPWLLFEVRERYGDVLRNAPYRIGGIVLGVQIGNGCSFLIGSVLSSLNRKAKFPMLEVR